MKQIELKQYITKTLGITYHAAGIQMEVSPQHLEAVANGRTPAGYVLRKKLAAWGNGKIDIAKLAMIEPQEKG